MKKRETEFWILVVVVSTIVILLTLMCVTLCKAVQLEKYESLSIHTEQLTSEQLEGMKLPRVQQVIVKEVIEEVEPEIKGFDIYDIDLEGKYQIKAQELCKEYEVSFPFFLAMCESESTFNDDAEGDKGRSIGLMQINIVNWDKYGLDARIPYDNLEIGIRMIAELIEKYGDMDMVVMAYKGGEGAANKWRQEGVRLSICDTIIERTQYFQDLIEKN